MPSDDIEFLHVRTHDYGGLYRAMSQSRSDSTLLRLIEYLEGIVRKRSSSPPRTWTILRGFLLLVASTETTWFPLSPSNVRSGERLSPEVETR